MADIGRNIEFLYEIGTLRYVPRSWRQFLNKDVANVAEHTFRVLWLSVIIAKEEGADIGKVVKMALVHDITESRTPEVHYLSRMYAKREEDKAIADSLRQVSVEKEFLALHEEYEERKTPEAKIVKDADNLDVEFELQEQYAKGIKLKESFKDSRDRVYELLFTKTARAIFEEVRKSNPHDWHAKGNNRFTNGDWKR